MLLSYLVLLPIMGIFSIVLRKFSSSTSILSKLSRSTVKFIALTASVLNLLISIILFILFEFSTIQFQFVQEYHNFSYFDFYLGIDGLSIYFVLLITIITPISLLSNWKSKDIESYFLIILLLECLLLLVFLVLDIFLFYIYFESILPPLFLLIGLFGSDNRIKASFYLFLYTLLGSLFLLLSILGMFSIMSATDYDSMFKKNFGFLTQVFLFYGIFIAFAVKTPTIFLNTWLLKAHVESPLGGSIVLAAIVLKLSLYGILRLILPVLPKAFIAFTYIVFAIGVVTIVYASTSTLRTFDVKELIAYSSVSHAAVYLIGLFSNSLQGIEGGISLGLAHGYVSPGLFIVVGGVLYDRYHTRIITFYKGLTQQLPLLAILFFILCLGNCGAPLTLNFIGEFLSLYGVFERSSLFGVFASSSIVFSAAFTIYMYQRISFGGQFTLATKENELVVKTEDKLDTNEMVVITEDKGDTSALVLIKENGMDSCESISNRLPSTGATSNMVVKTDDTLEVKINNIVKPDINERECTVLLPLVLLPVLLGIYAAPILDAIHFSSSSLLYMFDLDLDIVGFFAPTLFLRTGGRPTTPVELRGYAPGHVPGAIAPGGISDSNYHALIHKWNRGEDLSQAEYKDMINKTRNIRESAISLPVPRPTVFSEIMDINARYTRGLLINMYDDARRKYHNFTLNFTAFILPVLEIPLTTIFTSLAAMVDAYFGGLVCILLQKYRLYKLPSRVMRLWSLLVRISNYVITNKIVCYSIIVSAIAVTFLLYTPEVRCDAPRAWGLYFQDSASPHMEYLVELHDNIVYYLVTIFFAVGLVIFTLKSKDNSWKVLLLVFVFLVGLEVKYYLETINNLSNPGQTIFLVYILSWLMAIFCTLAYSYLLNLYTKFIKSSITKKLKNLLFELIISWRLLLISEKILVLYYIVVNLYLFGIQLFNMYSGCFMLSDVMLNISYYNWSDYSWSDYSWSELFCAPVELVSEGGGQPMSSLMPGLDDKDSLALKSSTNPNAPPQTNLDLYRIANCTGHEWVANRWNGSSTPKGLIHAHIPYCDFNATVVEGRAHLHPAVNPSIGQRRFFTCKICPAISCDPCAVTDE